MKTMLFFGVSILLVLSSCNGGKNSAATNSNAMVTEDDTEYLKVVTIKSGDSVVLDNPRTFIEIGILFNHAQRQWIKTLQANTNLVQEEYQDVKREEFYKSLGISEADVAIYNQNHYNEIEEFLANNDEYREAYHLSAGSDYQEEYEY